MVWRPASSYVGLRRDRLAPKGYRDGLTRRGRTINRHGSFALKHHVVAEDTGELHFRLRGQGRQEKNSKTCEHSFDHHLPNHCWGYESLGPYGVLGRENRSGEQWFDMTLKEIFTDEIGNGLGMCIKRLEIAIAHFGGYLVAHVQELPEAGVVLGA